MHEVINKLRERHRDGEEGFTLIELMVVVLIIAILLAIAIPTFLGARKRAQDRAAQSSLRNALTAAKTIYTDNSTYTSANAAGLLAVEPSLTYSDDVASTGAKNVSVLPALDGASWSAAALAASGTCFTIKESNAGTTFGSGGTCTGTGAVTTATKDSW